MDPMDIDSDFYGDEETVQSLEQRVQKFDVAAYLKTPPSAPRAMRKSEPDDQKTPTQIALHNPYAGVPYAWQLSESVDDFLERLPPYATEASPECPWIFICNPFIERKGTRHGLPRGCENEGPQSAGAQVSLFVEGGSERLRMFDFLRNQILQMDSANPRLRAGSTILSSQASNALAKERSDAVADIAALAQNLGVTCGKWMLFPELEDVDKVWSIVAKATARGELGVAAKVAPTPPDNILAARLVCVYTADFGDVQDVGRVLLRLRELGLIRASRQIYYKTDAYTYLGIASGNKWEIRPSLYSSNQVFGLVNGR